MVLRQGDTNSPKYSGPSISPEAVGSPMDMTSAPALIWASPKVAMTSVERAMSSLTNGLSFIMERMKGLTSIREVARLIGPVRLPMTGVSAFSPLSRAMASSTTGMRPLLWGVSILQPFQLVRAV